MNEFQTCFERNSGDVKVPRSRTHFSFKMCRSLDFHPMTSQIQPFCFNAPNFSPLARWVFLKLGSNKGATPHFPVPPPLPFLRLQLVVTESMNGSEPHCKLQMQLGMPGPESMPERMQTECRTKCPNICKIECQNNSKHMPDRMLERLPESMSEINLIIFPTEPGTRILKNTELWQRESFTKLGSHGPT